MAQTTEKAAPEQATARPWTVQKLNHVNGELWLQIGFFDDEGREIGPICELVGGAVKLFRPVAEFQHLVASEAEVTANAQLIVTAVNAYESNQQRIAELEEALRPFAKCNPVKMGIQKKPCADLGTTLCTGCRARAALETKE